MKVMREVTSQKSVDRDLACAMCKYNLRGLPTEGRCPECGELISVSIQLDEERRAIAVRPLTDRRMVNELLEGTAIALLSFAIGLAVALAPSSAFELKTQSRVLMLKLIATSWVLSFVGGWKLSSPDRQFQYEPRGSARRTLRKAWLAFAASAFLAYLFAGVMGLQSIGIAFALVCIIAMIVAAAAYYVWLARLLEATDSTILPVICFIMAIINALIAFFMLVPDFDADESSLAAIFSAATLHFGSLHALTETLKFIQAMNPFDWLDGLRLCWYAAVVTVHARLLMLLVRTDRKLRKSGGSIRRIRWY